MPSPRKPPRKPVSEEDVLPFVKDVSTLPLQDLISNVRGKVYSRNEDGFQINVKIFNGGLTSRSCLLVLPLDARDISEVIKFCNLHDLIPSIKSGGYGTHGYSIEGDVIIDIQQLHAVSFSIEDTPLPGSAAAMDIAQPSERDKFLDALRSYPLSPIDPYAAPELLKRKREIAFAEGENTPSPPSASSAPSSARPSISSTRAGSSSENPRSADMERQRSSASGSGSSTSKSTTSEGSSQQSWEKERSADAIQRRLKPRRLSPENFPAAEDELLAKGAPMPTVQTEDVDPPLPSTASTAPSYTASPDANSPRTPAERSTGSPHSSTDDLKDVKPDTEGGDSLVAGTGGNVQVRFDNSRHSVAFPDSLVPPQAINPRLIVASNAIPARRPFQYDTGPSTSTPAAAPPSADLIADSSSAGWSNSYPTHPITPPAPFVYATFGAGATQKQVDGYMSQHPLKGKTAIGTAIDVPYYVPFAAHPVGTTVMLQGGFGYQSRFRGLSIDALVEVEMVLADGRIVVINAEEQPDLFWAVRGAGTAFGIATRYRAKAYPIPVVYAGNVIYEFKRSTAASLLKHFRDCVKAAPKELYANAILTAGPRRNGALVVIQLCWLGPKEGGTPFLNAIMSWTGGRCLLNEVNEKTFANQQDSIAKVLKAAAGRKWFLRADVVTSLTDDLVHNTVESFADSPDGCAWLFELGGGAIAEFEDTPLTPAMRQGSFNIVAFHQWKVEDVDLRCVTSASDWMRDHVNAHSAGGPLPSFFERCELVSRTIGVYGDENWARLTRVKREYDPKGLMRHNFWPLDEDGRPLGIDALPVGRSSTKAPVGDAKGKGKDDLRTGNHFMDRQLAP